MKKREIIKHTDPAHGWYQVERKELEQLGILEKISGYSYQSQSGETVYLEEDRDASIFFNNLDIKPDDISFIRINRNSDSFVRSLLSFQI